MRGRRVVRDRERARAILADAARDPDNRAAVAHLCLFDARVARRSGDATGAKALALDAAERFAAIGMPWEESQAHELAGEPALALALYGNSVSSARCGASPRLAVARAIARTPVDSRHAKSTSHGSPPRA